jgi:REP element-mobilizing transposase RayT
MALFEAMRLIISGMRYAKIFRWPKFADALTPFYYKPYFWNHAYALISVGGRNILETLLKHIENQDDTRKLG